MTGIEKIKAFVSKYGADIVAAIKGKEIYFSVIVAQMCLESGYGESATAKNYNNFGGVRNLKKELLPFANGIAGAKKYATYNTPADYFKGHVWVLSRQRYIDNGLYTATSSEQQLWAIANGGYCEDPPMPKDYVAAILPILNKVESLYKIGKVA